MLLTGRARGTAVSAAYVTGYHLAMLTGAGVALCGAIASLTRASHTASMRPPSNQS
ncbi:MAG: hypothetical protein ABSG36_07410 [Acidimicrobiales bacterium]